MRKRLLPALLFLVLFLALVPISAFAFPMTLTQQTTGDLANVDKEFVYYIAKTALGYDTPIATIDETLPNVEVMNRQIRFCDCGEIFDSLDPDFNAKWQAHTTPTSWEDIDKICPGSGLVSTQQLYKIIIKNGDKIELDASFINLFTTHDDNYSFSFIAEDNVVNGALEYESMKYYFAPTSIRDTTSLIVKQTYGDEDTTTNETSFPDVPSNSEYATAIGYVSKKGVMVGDDQGRFNPDTIVSRAEMATIVCRVLEQTENLSKSDVFSDVPAEHWANTYIGKASELGIVNGYGEGMFGPSDDVAYEQAVTMIVRAIGEENKAVSYGGYPNGYLLAAQERNLLEGIQAVQGQGLSRGWVAVLLYNYYTAQNDPAASEDGHTHNWATRHIDEVGHWEDGGTYTTIINWCDCGAVFYQDDPDYATKWAEHRKIINSDGTRNPDACRMAWRQEILEYSNDPQYVIDSPAREETYCSICGVIQ